MEPGLRLKAVRELAGLSRTQMSMQVGIGYPRYANIEQLKVRMAVEDLEKVLAILPEFESWLARGTRVDLAKLKKGSPLAKQAFERVEAGEIPERQLREVFNR